MLHKAHALKGKIIDHRMNPNYVGKILDCEVCSKNLVLLMLQDFKRPS